MDCEAMNNAMSDFIDALIEAVSIFMDGLRKLVEAISKAVKAILDTIYSYYVTPREYHLMTRCKKARTRKKWRNILHERVRKAMSRMYRD